MQGELAPFRLPGAFDLSIRRDEGRLCGGDAAAHEGLDGEALIPPFQRLDARHAAVQKVAHGAEGVMVERDHAARAVFADGAAALLV